MGMISVDNLECGMVLAADVKDRSDRILLAAGQEITEKHLRIFKMWGVIGVSVQGVENEEAAAKAIKAVDPERLKQTEAEMQALFAHANLENPFMKELLRLATLRAAGQVEGDQSHGN
jgi:hypothetical protein